MIGCRRSWIAAVRFWTCCTNWLNSPSFAPSIEAGGPLEASSGSPRPTSREDRRLALTERFWDFLAMVLLEKVWEMCMFKSLSPLPSAPICCRQITLRTDSPHRICKTTTGQKPGPGFFPGRRHSDAQVSGAFRREGWATDKEWSNGQKESPPMEVFVTLL